MGGMTFGDEFVPLALFRGMDVDFLVIEGPEERANSHGALQNDISTTLNELYAAQERN